jgi:hypothetical protein
MGCDHVQFKVDPEIVIQLVHSGVRVYASPYTPEFNGYAFIYTEDGDRFDASNGLTLENVDIVMTHGPSSVPNHTSYTLDADQEGRHFGCGKLTDAIQRMRPKMHRFRHIHEGRGAMQMGCDADAVGEFQPVDDIGGDLLRIMGSDEGASTLSVNAARLNNAKEWLVDINLGATGSSGDR